VDAVRPPHRYLHRPPRAAGRCPGRSPGRHTAVAAGGQFSIVIDGQLVEHQVPASQSRELTALLGLRDTTVALLAAESATAEDSEHIDGLRRELNTRYDAYSKRWGPINRITYRRTGRVDEVTGEDLLARIAPLQGRFKIDPHSPAVYALEDSDATARTAPSNWSLHDLRHTAAYRMARDPQMPLTDVQWVLGHAHLSTTQRYLNPVTEDVIAGVLAFHQRQRDPDQDMPPATGYRAESLQILFGEDES
jgi:hypothetical protein